MQSKTKVIYENCRVLDISGNLLFKTSRKRLDWYLARHLANEIDPGTIQLTFANKGSGRTHEPFYLQDMRNACVVCNSDRQLTQHHVVPYQYRQFMSEEIKSRSSFDLLPLCARCHDAYERHAVLFKKHLAACYDSPLLGIGWVERRDIGSAGKAAAALLARNNKIPESRLCELRNTVHAVSIDRKDLFSDEARKYIEGWCRSTEEDVFGMEELVLQELCDMEVRVAGPDFRAHGDLVVDSVATHRVLPSMCALCRAIAIGGVMELVVAWRRHFVKHARPAYMPEHWIVEYPVL
ncbi:hypothetical protein LPJ66_008901 [Kickxella alabastrina]|uniref:Uncharacterized protein n=1 Tax=Kickxella alabastrina TaxID=61397 RepID=A0ACC1I5B9_9FUNG|nr:hypothetical protein LPJ66_008901 [Kickxella alabastrina]